MRGARESDRHPQVVRGTNSDCSVSMPAAARGGAERYHLSNNVRGAAQITAQVLVWGATTVIFLVLRVALRVAGLVRSDFRLRSDSQGYRGSRHQGRSFKRAWVVVRKEGGPEESGDPNQRALCRCRDLVFVSVSSCASPPLPLIAVSRSRIRSVSLSDQIVLFSVVQ